MQSGDPATFIVGAIGVVRSTQWQISTDAGADWSNLPGATAQTYAIIATAGKNGYEYRAVLSNSAGSATTRAATLTVNAPLPQFAPQVTTQPANQTVASGDYVTFTAAASGSPTPDAQWEVSSNGDQSWSTIIGADSTTYTFQATVGETGHEYRFVFNATATNGAASGAISSWAYQPLEMMSSSASTVLSTPGPLTAGGSGFDVTWDAGS